jgi:alpha-L-rhamnosidase
MLELTRDGYTRVAYQALTNAHFPQWLYLVTNGTPGVFQETTISEHWNSYISGAGGGYLGGDNSFNHYALGSVGEWIYKVVGGISPDDETPAYQNALIYPRAGGDITNCFASLDTICGRIATSWTHDPASTVSMLNFTNTANTTASLYLPTTDLTNITESGMPATNAVGVLRCSVTNGATLFQLGSGGYSFVVTNAVSPP